MTGSAFPLLDAILSESREALPAESTLRSQVVDLVYEAVATGDRVRAADALVIVGQLLAALRHYAQTAGEKGPTLVTFSGHPGALDHLSPIHRSSRVEEVPHLYVATGLGAALRNGGRSSTVLGTEFRATLESLLLASKIHHHLVSLTPSRGAASGGRWKLAKPTNTSMVTFELGGNPYEVSSEIAAQAAFSRYSQFAPDIATLAIHVGLGRAMQASSLIPLKDLFWLLDAVLETAAMSDMPSLFEQGGATGTVFGPALFVGDGRSDIAGFVDCSGLERMGDAPTFSFGASYADQPDGLRDPDIRRAFVNDAISRLLIDAGFPEAEELVQRLPE